MNSSNSTWNVRGAPAFGVRRAFNLSQTLQRFSTAEGYTQHPIYNTQKPNWETAIEYQSCPYASIMDDENYPKDSTYTDVMYLRDNMRDAYKQAFNLSDEQAANMTFCEASLYADTIFAEMFEGLP